MLADEIMRDPYSHTHAAVVGYSYVPAPEDVSFLNWVDARANMAWQPGKVRPQPAERPWHNGPRQKAPARHDPHRAERRAALNKRLGITP